MKICKFPGARVIGKPEGWSEELDGPCDVIYVVDHIDVQTGYNTMFSIYKPTSEDLESLNNGGYIRLGILGTQHPTFKLGVIELDIPEIEPLQDMGGPIIIDRT